MLDGKQWMISWDINGIEAIVDIGDMIEQEAHDLMVYDHRKNETVSSLYHKFQIRARFNPERCLQVWTLRTSEEVDKESLEHLAKFDPNFLIELVKKHGVKLFGDGQETNWRET